MKPDPEYTRKLLTAFEDSPEPATYPASRSPAENTRSNRHRAGCKLNSFPLTGEHGRVFSLDTHSHRIIQATDCSSVHAIRKELGRRLTAGHKGSDDVALGDGQQQMRGVVLVVIDRDARAGLPPKVAGANQIGKHVGFSSSTHLILMAMRCPALNICAMGLTSMSKS